MKILRPHLSAKIGSLILLVILTVNIHAQSSGKCDSSHLNIIFDCGKNPCIAFSPKDIPKYLREGTAVTVSYSNVNPFAVNSNLIGTSSAATFTDGGDALQNIFTSIQKAQQNANVSDTNPAPTTATKHPGRRKALAQNNKPEPETAAQTIMRLVRAKNSILEKMSVQKNNLSIYVETSNKILGLNKIIQNAMKDPNIHDESTFMNRINNNGRYPISSANDIYNGFDKALKDIMRL